MTSLLQQVRRTIRRHALCPPGSRVLIGLSGGSDSVALTLLLRELSEHAGFSVVALSHINHQLRRDAGRDEQLQKHQQSKSDVRPPEEAIDLPVFFGRGKR